MPQRLDFQSIIMALQDFWARQGCLIRQPYYTQVGDYLITGQGWQGTMPSGMTQISTPNNSVLVIGRILVYSDSDLPTAYNLAKQIQLTPLSQWQPGQ